MNSWPELDHFTIDSKGVALAAVFYSPLDLSHGLRDEGLRGFIGHFGIV